MTVVKVKVKGHRCRFVLSQWSRSLFVSTIIHVNCSHYISTINFKVQFMQVYDVIKNYMYGVASNFGRGLKINAITLSVFLIISNVVSLAVIPITHQEIIIDCRCI